MDWQTRVRDALSGLTGDSRRDAEILDELTQHLRDREADLRASGVAPDTIAALLEQELRDTAAAHARLRRAAASGTGDQTTAGRSPMRFWAEVRQDTRYGARLLARAPGFTAVALVTLALAIGATTAIFSVARGVLLRPLPYPDADRIVRVWETSPEGATRNVVSSGNYLDWRDRATSLSAIGALGQSVDRALTGDGEPSRVRTASIAPSVLDVLQVTPLAGRAFTAEDAQANAPAVALLTHRFWKTRFNGDPTAIGRTLLLDERPTTVAGVMREDFAFPSADVDLLTNLRFGPGARDERRAHNFLVIGRLADGASLGTAGTELRAIAAGLALEHPQFMKGWSVNVVPLHEDDVRTVRPLLAVLVGVALAVLLIACANLANLQLARASRRSHEMAVRAAIGAGQARMFRQMLTETVLLTSAGGTLGVAVAAGALRLILATAPDDIPFLERVTIDPVVLAVAAGATALSALIMGLAPALRAGRADLRPALQSTRLRPDRGQVRLRQVMLVAQIGLALVLLVSAALLARSFWQLSKVSPGFEAAGLLTVSIDLPASRYADMPAQHRFYDQVIERLAANPRVEAAAGTSGLPGESVNMTFSFAIEGRPASNPSGREHPVPLQGVSGDYFGTMRIPLLRGRGFTSADRAGAAPVIIINASLAERHWPGGGAVGSRINFRPGQLPWMEIVGIAGDTRDGGPAEEAQPMIYVPFAQRASSWGWMSWQTLVVRARSGNAGALVADVRAALWSIDPNLPLLDVATIDERFAENEARRRMAAGLIGAFALVALLLGTIGVYGVMSYAVSEQRQEIGLRIALGARPSSVAARIVRRGLALAAGGVGAGLVMAALATRALETLLFEVDPRDPASFGATAALLLTVAALAAWVPARRAMRVDPITVLRER